MSENTKRTSRGDITMAYRRLRREGHAAPDITPEMILNRLGTTATSLSTVSTAHRMLRAIDDLVQRGVITNDDLSITRLRRECPDLSFSNSTGQEIVDAWKLALIERVPPAGREGESVEEGGDKRESLSEEMSKAVALLPQQDMARYLAELNAAVEAERAAGERRLIEAHRRQDEREKQWRDERLRIEQEREAAIRKAEAQAADRHREVLLATERELRAGGHARMAIAIGITLVCGVIGGVLVRSYVRLGSDTPSVVLPSSPTQPERPAHPESVPAPAVSTPAVSAPAPTPTAITPDAGLHAPVPDASGAPRPSSP